MGSALAAARRSGMTTEVYVGTRSLSFEMASTLVMAAFDLIM
jgi:hypothetical protein